MSFEGLFDDDIPYAGAAVPAGAPRLPGLSLGPSQQTDGERQRGEMSSLALIAPGSGGDGDSAGRNKEEENDSRSGSENVEGFSGDDAERENPRKKKRYHRHTPQQIQELEALFTECQHPDEKQRMELSRRLSLESRQVKFWFQNRRTQRKTQTGRHENSILRQENDKLRAESLTLREAIRSPLCNNCGTISSLPSPFPPLHHSALDHVVGSNCAYANVPAVPELGSSDRDHTGIASAGRRSILKLAQRMTDNFCAGVSPSSSHKWTPLWVGIGDDAVRVMGRQSLNDPGEPRPYVVFSAAKSVWLPVAPGRLFDFLRDGCLCSELGIHSNGGPMQEMAHIAKGQDHRNAVSLYHPSNAGSSVLILQETCTDSFVSLVVYAPVDILAMHLAMNGGDSDYVDLIPSGYAIAPDLLPSEFAIAQDGPPSGDKRGGGSLLTVALQIVTDSDEKLAEHDDGGVRGVSEQLHIPPSAEDHGRVSLPELILNATYLPRFLSSYHF